MYADEHLFCNALPIDRSFGAVKNMLTRSPLSVLKHQYRFVSLSHVSSSLALVSLIRLSISPVSLLRYSTSFPNNFEVETLDMVDSLQKNTFLPISKKGLFYIDDDCRKRRYSFFLHRTDTRDLPDVPCIRDYRILSPYFWTVPEVVRCFK